MITIFARLGQQLRSVRKQRGLSQSELADRVGRSSTRVSELERDLAGDRWGRDRLTLFAEICDALDLVPVLVPRARVDEVERIVEGKTTPAGRPRPSTAFDDLFVDLDNDKEK
jgi:transcriptional regulator with XRE-family HTH domain